MAEKLKVEDLVKPVEALVAEKEAVEKRIQEVVTILDAALNKLGFQVMPLEARTRPGKGRRRKPAKAEARPAPRRGVAREEPSQPAAKARSRSPGRA